MTQMGQTAESALITLELPLGSCSRLAEQDRASGAEAPASSPEGKEII
jgi:hypothetical protein